ncbi:hypothetical protein [Aquimarina algiphila]|uniref:hypothetical protein n=1 Tax=Aquimarina algiphila TaxID=2047982 RepID=UPI0024929F15|nr:hypothetical protein [Aquimarina algiphila]
MEEFNNIIHRLKTNDKLCVEIKDYQNGNPIVPINDRIDGKAMIEKSGDIEGYFKELMDKGVTKIQIQLHRKQGSACVRDGLAYNCELGGEEKETVMQKPKETITPKMVQPQGLGYAETQGLGMADVIGLHVDRQMYNVAKSDLVIEKEKTVRLEKENRGLEEKIRQLEKSNDTKQFWGDTIKEVAPALTGIFTMMKTAPGLGSPAQETQLPDGLKGQLIKVIMDVPDTSSAPMMNAYYVLQAYSQNNQDFIQEMQQLLVKHNFITDGTNDTH